MEEKLNDISFAAFPSLKDSRTLNASAMVSQETIPEHAKVPLNYPTVDELCDQRRLGICTMCGVRMAVESEWKDGVRLDEYWGYLMGKTIYDDVTYGIHFEGSSALTMLKLANRYGIPEKEFCKKYPLKTDGSYQDFINDFKTTYGGEIPGDIIGNARKHKISGYYFVPVNPDAIAREIVKGKVVVTRWDIGDNAYRKADGTPTRLAKYLLPLRLPTKISGGHIWDLNEFWKKGAEQGGVNSWSRSWCPDNSKQEAGCFWYVFDLLKPYFTEAWAIMGKLDKYMFTKEMKLGDANPDVVALQKVLEREGCLVMPLNVSYGFFGGLTKNAVIKYQEKYANEILKPAGLIHGTGIVGSFTLKHLNK